MTINEKYQLVLEGNLTEKQFTRDARLGFPKIISSVNTYKDVVQILKNKGIITENTTSKVPDYDGHFKKIYENPADKFNITTIEHGIRAELGKKGIDMPTFEQYESAKSTVLSNLEKHQAYYQYERAGEPINKKRTDQYTEFKPSNTVDTDNGMVQHVLKEFLKSKIKELLK